ncbi:MAG: L,D-transpeptidase family protein [Chloroflexi bacterium]|nr:L,D-transpeptidase family protein [Chloroflexota bacterium]
MNNRPAHSHTSSGGNSRGNGRAAQVPAKKRSLFLPIVLIVTGCVVFVFAAWSAVTSPVLASFLNRNANTPQFQQPAPGESYAKVYLAKPTYTPAVIQPAAPEAQPTSTLIPTVLVQATEVLPTTQAEALQPTPTSEAVAIVETGVFVAEAAIVPDTPTPKYVEPTAAAYVPPVSSPGNGARWFDVDLSEQRMYAYEGDTLVNSFIVSTGTWQTPTVTGKFKVWIKLRSAPMSGPGYYLPDVPYIMYFYGDYGIHGTYWHNNFGVPMSHGCVNLSIPDAEWAYNFASVGTVVNVHD